ncbi:MAG: hypothetical protein ACI4T3_04110 [Lactobacillus sp.]
MQNYRDIDSDATNEEYHEFHNDMMTNYSRKNVESDKAEAIKFLTKNGYDKQFAHGIVHKLWK